MSARGGALSRLPLWVSALVALACVAAGVVLTVRPFSSVQVLVTLVGVVGIVTGVLILASIEVSPSRYRWFLGGAWVVFGVVILVWPHLSVRALAVVVGVALVVNGLVGIVRAFSHRSAEPTAEVIGGFGGIVFGVLALVWPDVTVLVVAVLFGARTVWFGLTELLAVVNAWRRGAGVSAASPATSRRPGRLRRGVRIGSRSLGLVVALALLAVSSALHAGGSSIPAFYDPPSQIASAPGQLLRSEAYTAGVPADGEAWLILYTTETSLGRPAVGSAIVLAPKRPPAGPRPVVLWDHGTVGIARACAPSLSADPFEAAPGVPQVINHGWVMVAPDYVGMGTAGPNPYLIGAGEAYSGLDAVRAAHQLKGLTLSEQTVVWGHSQGGNAALWTGALAPGYAPGVHLEGVAALAPATDLVSLAKSLQGKAVGDVLVAWLLAAYSTTYSDVHLDTYVQPGAIVAVEQTARRCLTDPGVVASIAIAKLQPDQVFAGSLDSGPLHARLSENTPTAKLTAPLLVAQGTADEVIPISINKAWVARQCAAGYKVEFQTYPGVTHVGIVEHPPAVSNLISWTTDRLAGERAPTNC